MSAPENREALRAADPELSVWVSANAGAGKTQILADRVTRLLLEGTDPARILCLTYTKAAAAEMTRRLYDRLGSWALLGEKDLAAALSDIGAGARDAANLRKARMLFAQALETPGGLKIQTIHSFCQSLLTRFPIEAGVAPGFQVLDERGAAELMRRARDSVLERANGGVGDLAKAVRALAARCDYAQFGKTIDAAVGQTRRKFKNILAPHDGDGARYAAFLRERLNIAPGLDEGAVVSRFCSALSSERKNCERLVRWLLSGTAGDKRAGERLARFLAASMDAQAFEDFSDVFLNGDGERRARLATKRLVDAEPDLHAYMLSLADRLEHMESERKAAAVATLSEFVVIVAGEVLKRYERLKRQQAALDYDDLTIYALALLDKSNAASWVLYKLDGGIEHVLIDEAQDTSPEQWRIITKLVEEFFSGAGIRDLARTPRTIFAVGDEKQSIFSFQGAAPDEFERNLLAFKERVEDARLEFEDIRPAISRRGAVSVLQFVDAVFAESTAHTGLTSSGGATRHEGNRSEIGRVEIWPAVKADKSEEPDAWAPVDAPSEFGAHAALAAQIADKIAGWLRDGTPMPGTGKPITPKDIMILVRRRRAFAEEMIRQLIARNVPVAGADRMQLAEQIAIMDLVALGRFALLPQDDLNLAALLKSPIVGFDEDALYQLAHAREGNLWAELIKRQNDKGEFSSAFRILSAAFAEADFYAPFEFFGRVLGRGARKNLIARLGAEASDAIDEFLSLALQYERAHPPSLEGFLDWLSRGADAVKRDLEDGTGAVRVMTVHGAKGLEADFVIVPDTAQAPKPETRAAILYSDDCVFYRVNKELETPLVTAAKAAERAREMNEYRRLLYVALTRARNWLILCGHENKRGMDAESWYPMIDAAARKICREEPDGTRNILVLGESLKQPTSQAKEEKTEKPVLPSFLSRAAVAETERPRILRPSESLGEEPPLRSPSADNIRFGRGQILHALLAALPNIASVGQHSAALRYCAKRGLDSRNADAIAAEALAIVERADFSALFAPGSRAEIQIVADLPELGPGVRINGQLDRLAVGEREVLIADFKSNRAPPKNESDVPKLYVRQMALYRAALAKLYPGREISCALIWTEGPSLMKLPAPLLDAELAAIRVQLAAISTP